jgi:hypothetical protein
VSDYKLDDWSSIPGRDKGFFSSLCVQTGSGAHHAPIRWVPGVLSPGVKRHGGVTLATHPHLVPKSGMIRNNTSSPPYRLHGGNWTTLLTFHAYCNYAPNVVCSLWFSDRHFAYTASPKAVVEWLTLLLHAREVSGFKYQLEDVLSWLRAFVAPSVPLGKYRDSTFKLGHDRFLLNPFQSIIHSSSFHSTLYSLSYWKSVVKLNTNNKVK